jgi:hypothetical protein
VMVYGHGGDLARFVENVPSVPVFCPAFPEVKAGTAAAYENGAAIVGFSGDAVLKELDESGEVRCVYVGHGPELESAVRPSHNIVTLARFGRLS